MYSPNAAHQTKLGAYLISGGFSWGCPFCHLLMCFFHSPISPSFSPIENQIKAAKYITKYIDKQLKAGHIRNIREQIPDAKLLLHSRGLRKAIKLFFRKDALPEAIHRTVDAETGEVCFSFRTWGACRTDQDLSKLCKTIATAYDTDGYEIFGYVLGSIELLRKIEYFDIKI